MATPASVLVTTVLQRVRDPHGAMHARADVLTLLGHVQRLVNGMTAHRVVTATLTLVPHQWMYPIEALLPTAQSVTGVRHDNRWLDRSAWTDWWATDRGFTRTLALRPLMWDAIGHDFLLVWPAVASSGVEVTATERLPDFANETEDVLLHESLHTLLLDALEVVLLVKGRSAGPAPAALAALSGALARAQG